MDRPKILIVENGQDLLDALAALLKGDGLEVVTALSSEEARIKLKDNPFDLMIVDIDLPGESGVDLVSSLKKDPMHSQTLTIFMSGYGYLLDDPKATPNLANQFLQKPFSGRDLLKGVRSLLGWKTSENPKTDDQEKFFEILIEEFLQDPRNDFDLYVQLARGRYLKVAHSGSPLYVERVRRYMTKGVRVLHIRSQDFARLVDYTAQDPLPADMAKLQRDLLSFSEQIIYQHGRALGFDPEPLAEAMQTLLPALELISNSKSALELMVRIKEHDDEIYAHSLMCALINTLAARKMGVASTRNLFTLILASLFHDVGKKELDPQLLRVPRAGLSADNAQRLRSHVVRSREIAEAIPNMPADVIRLVYEHHENLNGTGYPRGLKAEQLHPLSPLFITVERFVESFIENREPTQATRNAVRILAHFREHESAAISTGVVQTLQTLMHH